MDEGREGVKEGGEIERERMRDGRTVTESVQNRDSAREERLIHQRRSCRDKEERDSEREREIV